MYAQFRREVWAHYRTHGRHDLPWRKTKNPYRILVSEVMLQQTQVSRVIEKYREFLKEFPTVSALAEAPLSRVLASWRGLGYNRRAKFLHDAAKAVISDSGGRLPKTAPELRALPGVGPYTASAVAVFAYNQPEILIETNIRTVFLHHFHTSVLQNNKISDADILSLAKKGAVGQDPREWHWALMDYGAHLKASGVRLNARSAHYTKQSKFEGSLRQVRGAVIRALHVGPQSAAALSKELAYPLERIEEALAALAQDELISKQRTRWSIQ